MKVAVTGASGFIGRPLCAALERAGHEVIPVDLRNSDVAGEVVVGTRAFVGTTWPVHVPHEPVAQVCVPAWQAPTPSVPVGPV